MCDAQTQNTEVISSPQIQYFGRGLRIRTQRVPAETIAFVAAAQALLGRPRAVKVTA